MALKDTWKDKVDGVDDVLAEDINSIAHSVIELEEGGDEKEKVLFVTIADGVASHNAVQIAEYADNGYLVYLIPHENSGEKFALSRYYAVDNEEAVADFSYPSAEELLFNSWYVYANGSVDHYEDAAASSSQIGDIDSALDELHTYAQTLVNGGAS